jgi:hypothetical protein
MKIDEVRLLKGFLKILGCLDRIAYVVGAVLIGICCVYILLAVIEITVIKPSNAEVYQRVVVGLIQAGEGLVMGVLTLLVVRRMKKDTSELQKNA